MINKLKKIFISIIPNKALRKKFRDKYTIKIKPILNIKEHTRCLMVCPHADDEMLGGGGVMLKYAPNFDCVCMASAGVKTVDIGAEARSELRIKEFHKVMDAVGIKNRWISKTFGIPPMIAQIKKHFKSYCQVINPKTYDYIFLPHPKDSHPEHKYITNKLFKKILRKKGYNKHTQIVFYEVWTPIESPNYYEDISEVASKKFRIIELYNSQNIWIKYFDRVEGLNKYRGMLARNVPYAEAFKIIPISKYVR